MIWSPLSLVENDVSIFFFMSKKCRKKVVLAVFYQDLEKMPENAQNHGAFFCPQKNARLVQKNASFSIWGIKNARLATMDEGLRILDSQNCWVLIRRGVSGEGGRPLPRGEKNPKQAFLLIFFCCAQIRENEAVSVFKWAKKSIDGATNLGFNLT